MSSTFSIGIPKNLVRTARRFHSVDFLIKSTPAISLAFIIYVTFRGGFWWRPLF